MESTVPRKGLRKNSPAAIAAAFFMLGAFHSAALAATGTNSQCATEARDLTSLDIGHNTLTVETVDHDSAKTEVASLAAMEADTGSAETSSPLLYLTPRVTSLLRDIFRIQKDPNTGTLNKPSSPLAGSTDDVEPKISAEDVTPLSGSDEVFLPSLQQQMFRKDI